MSSGPWKVKYEPGDGRPCRKGHDAKHRRFRPGKRSRCQICYRAKNRAYYHREMEAINAYFEHCDTLRPEVEPMERQLFLDCDGVLADMDKGAELVLGMSPRKYEQKYGPQNMWACLKKYPNFYAELPLIKDAYALYFGVIALGFAPIILTGCPKGNWAAPQKQLWAAEHFPGVKMICCSSKDKNIHGKPGDVLIDDWLQHKDAWLHMGGIWITHTSAAESLNQLKAFAGDR